MKGLNVKFAFYSKFLESITNQRTPIKGQVSYYYVFAGQIQEPHVHVARDTHRTKVRLNFNLKVVFCKLDHARERILREAYFFEVLVFCAVNW